MIAGRQATTITLVSSEDLRLMLEIQKAMRMLGIESAMQERELFPLLQELRQALKDEIEAQQ